MGHEASSAGDDSPRVPASSRQQAMDWSLVLASQGIPHLIASPRENDTWSLVVTAEDLQRAQAVIQTYEAENIRRPWQQSYLEGRAVVDWGALAWGVLLVAVHALASGDPTIKDAGIMHGMAVSGGEWWRLITATQLHSDGAHLLSNLSIGVLLLALVMGRWGTATGLLAALLAGVGGNLGNWLLQPANYSLGASGVVMGCLGLLALAPGHHAPTARHPWRNVFASIAAAVLLFVLLGLDPRSDVMAHAGGFVTGLMLAALLRVVPGLSRSTRAEAIAALLVAVLVLVPWKMAFSHAPVGN